MRFTTFYFSGTGNTKWAAEQFDAAAIENGDESMSVSIETPPSDLKSVLDESDMIGIAFPVYSMNVPAIMQNFITRLNASLSEASIPKPLYVLVTAGYADGCGPYQVSHAFTPGTIHLRGYVGLKMALNLCAPPRNTTALSPALLLQRLITARHKINKLADALHAGYKKVPPGPYAIVMFRKKLMARTANMYKELSVCTDTCSGCYACMHNCPAKSIRLKDGVIEFTNGCTSCFRCFNNCPTASIWYKGNYADPALYPRYTGPAAAEKKQDLRL